MILFILINKNNNRADRKVTVLNAYSIYYVQQANFKNKMSAYCFVVLSTFFVVVKGVNFIGDNKTVA